MVKSRSWSQLNAILPKTHISLIAAFSVRYVKSRQLSRELERYLSNLEDVRLIADYTATPSISHWQRTVFGKLKYFCLLD